MKTFFEKTVQHELHQRFQKLNANIPAQWGKMTAAQMLSHCTVAIQVPIGELKLQRNAMGLIGWMFKGMLVSDKPFTKNSPTAKEFRMHDPKNFDEEMKRFHESFSKLARGPEAVVCWKHPFFGKMSCDDWGRLMYKHLDHHLRQFGV